jgi:hypothetical protein
MTEVMMERTIGGCKAASEDAHRLLAHIPIGQEFVADVRDNRRRSTDQHRFWFSMVNALYESQEHYKSLDTFRRAMLVAMGYCQEYKLKDGRIYYEPESLKFGKMPQERFSQLVNDTLDFAEGLGFNRDELLMFTRERAGRVY